MFTWQELKEMHQKQCGKPLQVMVAVGPYTVNNELSFEGLKDLVQLINREKPHALILAGPFINQQHEDVMSGDLKCNDPSTGAEQFLDYNSLFKEIMDYLYKNMTDKNQT